MSSVTKQDLAKVQASLKSSDEMFDELAAPVRQSSMDDAAKGQLLAMIWKEYIEPIRRPLHKLERELNRKLKKQL